AVGRHVAEQRVSGVQLPEQADDLFLRGRPVAQVRARRVPDLLYRALAIHQADEMMGGRRKAMRALRGLILQHEPYFVAERLAQNAGMRPDARLERRDPVPGRA